MGIFTWLFKNPDQCLHDWHELPTEHINNIQQKVFDARKLLDKNIIFMYDEHIKRNIEAEKIWKENKGSKGID